MSNVFGLVQQVRHQFLSGHPRVADQTRRKRTQHVPRHREMIRRHGVVEVVQVRRVLEVAVDDVAGTSIGCDAMEVETTNLFVTQELEISDRQRLALGSGI